MVSKCKSFSRKSLFDFRWILLHPIKQWQFKALLRFTINPFSIPWIYCMGCWRGTTVVIDDIRLFYLGWYDPPYQYVVIQRMNWNAYPLMLHPLWISAYPAVMRHLKVGNIKRLLLLLRHSSVDSNGCWPRVLNYIYSQAEQLTQITPECVWLGWIKLSEWLPHGSIFKSASVDHGNQRWKQILVTVTLCWLAQHSPLGCVLWIIEKSYHILVRSMRVIRVGELYYRWFLTSSFMVYLIYK